MINWKFQKLNSDWWKIRKKDCHTHL
jgi:hypothetical protein